MTDFVLVHGGHHAAWCWGRIVPYLKEDPRVRTVTAIDLVGHGSRLDEKKQEEITPDDYVQDIVDVIDHQDLRNIILVGHSLGGISIPRAASHFPDRIHRLIYISAFVPFEGKSIMETVEEIGMDVDPSLNTAELLHRHIFCNDMDEETTQWLLGNLGPEPASGLITPLNLKRFTQTAPSTFVLLTRDQAIPPDTQRRFISNLGNPEVVELESGHDAMISHPAELSRVLLKYI